MRPKWLGGWRPWADVRPAVDAHDPRPLWQRLAAFIGVRKHW